MLRGFPCAHTGHGGAQAFDHASPGGQAQVDFARVERQQAPFLLEGCCSMARVKARR